jgi:O-antigen/teichoic acid export membrane protein
LASYLRMGLGAAVTLAITRAILKVLGQANYSGTSVQAAFGALSLVIAVSGILGFLDQGGGALVRALAMRMAHADEAKRVFNSGWWVCFVGGVVRSVGLFFLAPSMPRWVGLHGPLAADAILALRFLALGQVLESCTSPWAAVLAAQERFPLEYGRIFVGQILRLLLSLAAIYFPWGVIPGLACAWIGSQVLTQAGVAIYLAMDDPRWRWNPAWVSRKEMHELARFGGWASLTQAATNLFERFDQVVCTAFLGPEMNGAYAIADTPRVQVANFSMVVNGVLLPVAARASAAGAKAELRRILVGSTRLSLALCLGLAIPLSYFAAPAVMLWLGPGHEAAAALFPMALAVQTLRMSKGAGWNVFLALGHPQWPAVAQVVEGFLNQSMSLILILGFGWGITGVYAGTILASLVRISLQWPRLADLLGVETMPLVWAATGLPMVGGLGLGLACWGLRALSLGWAAILGLLCLLGLAYLLWIWLAILEASERQAVGHAVGWRGAVN